MTYLNKSLDKLRLISASLHSRVVVPCLIFINNVVSLNFTSYNIIKYSQSEVTNTHPQLTTVKPKSTKF